MKFHLIYSYIFVTFYLSIPVEGQIIADSKPLIVINSSEERGGELKINFAIVGPENEYYNVNFYIKEVDDFFVPKFVLGNLTKLRSGSENFIVWQFRKEGIFEIKDVEYKLELIPFSLEFGGRELRIERLGRNYWTLDDISSINDPSTIVGFNVGNKSNWGELYNPGYFIKKSVSSTNFLFNSYALLGDSLVCPKGWRVPSLEDFLDLVIFLNEPGKYYSTLDYGLYNNRAGMGNFWFVGQSLKGCISPFGSEEMMEEGWLWWTNVQSTSVNEWIGFLFNIDGESYSASLSRNAGMHVRCVCSSPSE